jgi:hypothetical protein
MSEDYIRQYGMVQNHRVFIVNKSRFAGETADAVGAVLLNRVFLR